MNEKFLSIQVRNAKSTRRKKAYAKEIPAKVLQEILSMTEVDGEITLIHSGSKILFTFENLLVTTRIIDGVFPPYERVFPKENEIAEKITIGMSKSLAPVDFQAENFHYVVTPVRRS